MRANYYKTAQAQAHSHPEGGVCFITVTGIDGVDQSALKDMLLSPIRF